MESADARHRARWAPQTWELWHNRRPLIALLVTIELAVAVLVATTASAEVSTTELGKLISLLVVGVVFEEISRRVSNLRLRVANLSYFDMSSVWTFAAALTLSAGPVTLLVVLLRLHMWLRYQRRTRHQVYRHVYTCAVIVLSCLASGATFRTVQVWLAPTSVDIATAVAIGLAILVYRVTNTPLIAAAVALASPGAGWRSLVGTPEANGLELATLCLGVATAFMALWDAILLPVMLAPVIILQRAAMVNELARAATIDFKTGLLNLSTWTHVGTTELSRASRQSEEAALLMIDLDHFKQINDAIGHLAGDDALRLVADAITAELRDYDIIGRFGGEEFVALLPNTDADAAREAAERLRKGIKKLSMPGQQHTSKVGPSLLVTISTGIACYPGHGDDLESLLDAADAALFRAKSAGRDRVEFAPGPASIPDALGSPS